MTYVPHLLLQFGGRLFDTEEWSCNIRLYSSVYEAQGGEARLNFAEAQVEDYANDCAAYVQDLQGWFSSAAKLDYVKLNPIGPNGRYENATTTVRYDFLTDVPQGVRDPGPAQVALVVSHLTERARGRASRGRHYVPCGVMDINEGNGRISTQVCIDQADAAAQFFTNLNNQPGPDLPGGPVVNVISGLGTPGPHEQVTQVAVGNVVDTQRRRREDLPETYSLAPVSGLNT